MREISKQELEKLDRVYRLKLVNSLSGFKSANLIASVSKSGESNVAIFSSVVHLGSDPALIAFVMRPRTVPRDTYRNIKEIGQYTINHVHESIVEKAHITSGSWSESEFRKSGLTEEHHKGFTAPFVKESKIKFAVSFADELPIRQNGTLLIVGQIEKIFLQEDLINKDGALDLFQAKSATVSGLNSYGVVSKLAEHDYVRVKDK